MIYILIPLGIAALFIWLAVVLVRKSNREEADRREMLLHLAQQQDLTLVNDEAKRKWAKALVAGTVLRGTTLTNAMAATIGDKAVLFGDVYSQTFTSEVQGQRTVAVIRPTGQLPIFTIVHESVTTRLSKKSLGFPEFDEKYRFAGHGLLEVFDDDLLEELVKHTVREISVYEDALTIFLPGLATQSEYEWLIAFTWQIVACITELPPAYDGANEDDGGAEA